MRKGLINRIGKKIILPLVIAGIVSGCIKYERELEVNGNIVYYNTLQAGEVSLHDVKEKKKDGTRITYDIIPDLEDNPKKFELEDFGLHINGKCFSKVNYPLIHSKANERVNFLINRYYFVRDSTKKANDSIRKANALKALE